MTLVGLVLCLLTVSDGVLSLQLEESGPGLVKPSQSLSLTCTVSDGSITSGYAWSWIRQLPGRTLEWMGYISSGSTYYNPSLKSRISITINTATNQFFLQLNSVTTGDTATYYCARGGWGADYAFDIWGTGTLVTVSSVSMTSPQIFPLSLPWPKSGNSVMIGCLIKDFFPPESVTVTWGKSGEQVNFPPVGDEKSLYTMISQLTLTTDECPKHANVTCSVKQDTSKLKEVDVPCSAPQGQTCKPCTPSLSLQRPSLEDLLLGSDASLKCTLRGLKSSNAATFSWKPSGKVSIQPVELDSCGCYSVSSVLHGCAEPWNHGETFTCTVNHSDLPEPMTATIRKATDLFPPQVHLLPPPSEELALNELVSLTCLVRGFSPKEVLVLWQHENNNLSKNKYLVWEPLREPNEGATTYAVTSVLRVTASDWKKGDNFSCMVGHEALSPPFTQKTINYYTGKPTHVNVSVIMSEADGTCY